MQTARDIAKLRPAAHLRTRIRPPAASQHSAGTRSCAMCAEVGAALPLTARQRDVLAAIEHSIAERGIAPTLREVGDHLGIASLNGVSEIVRRLERKGYVARAFNRRRGLTLLRGAA